MGICVNGSILKQLQYQDLGYCHIDSDCSRYTWLSSPYTSSSSYWHSFEGHPSATIAHREANYQRPALTDVSDHCNTYYDGVCTAEEKGNEFPYFVHVYLL